MKIQSYLLQVTGWRHRRQKRQDVQPSKETEVPVAQCKPKLNILVCCVFVQQDRARKEESCGLALGFAQLFKMGLVKEGFGNSCCECKVFDIRQTSVTSAL